MAPAAHKLSSQFVTRTSRAVLGVKYELTVAYVDAQTMRRLNRTYREKDKATNILAFPYAKESGEIVLCLPKIPKQAYLEYLFIHGLVHLKGHKHGRIMDTLEHRYCRRFNITHPDDTKNSSRH